MVDLAKKEFRAWTRLVRVHAALTELIDARLKAVGLPPVAWYPLLSELERAEDGGLRPFELEQATGEAQYAISRLLDRMAKAGAISRQACEDDRRGWRVALTDEGRAVKSRMWEVYSQTLADNFVEPLSGKQIKALDEILGDLFTQASLVPRQRRHP